MLSKDQIVEAASRTNFELVDVPELGGEVGIKMMTGFERDQFERAVLDKKNDDGSFDLRGMRAHLAVLTLCDGNGKLLFTADDMAVVNRLSALALDKIADKAVDFNKLSKEDIKEELQKN